MAAKVYRETAFFRYRGKFGQASSLACSEHAEELRRGVGQAGAAAGNQIDMTRHIELADFDFFHPAVFDFPLHAHARNDGHAHAHLDEAFDAFDGGHFNGHIERGAIAGKQLDHAAAKRRFNDVSDEDFVVELRDVDLALSGEGVLGRHDERKFVFEDFGGLELRVARHEGDRAEVQAIVEDFVRDIAREHAMHADEHAGVLLAKGAESRKQGMNRAFVDAEGEFAAGEAAKLIKPFFDFVAEIDEALGVIAKEVARVGEAHRARAADEERLSETLLEFADGEADGRLCAVKAFGGAREAALAGDGQENLQFTEVHGGAGALLGAGPV
jgi:hypothetical protein